MGMFGDKSWGATRKAGNRQLTTRDCGPHKLSTYRDFALAIFAVAPTAPGSADGLRAVAQAEVPEPAERIGGSGGQGAHACSRSAGCRSRSRVRPVCRV